MKSKIKIFDTNERIRRNLVPSAAAELSSEFGLRISRIFEDTIRNAKVYGVLAGQASSLYQIYNFKPKR